MAFGLIAGGVALGVVSVVSGAIASNMLEKGISDAMNKDEDEIDVDEYDEEEEE